MLHPSLVAVRRKDTPKAPIHAAWKHSAERAALLPLLRTLRPICYEPDDPIGKRMLYANLEVTPLTEMPTCRVCHRLVAGLLPGLSYVSY